MIPPITLEVYAGSPTSTERTAPTESTPGITPQLENARSSRNVSSSCWLELTRDNSICLLIYGASNLICELLYPLKIFESLRHGQTQILANQSPIFLNKTAHPTLVARQFSWKDFYSNGAIELCVLGE